VRVIGLVIVAGCWGSPPPPAPAPPEPAPVAAPVAQAPVHKSTRWKGRYVCAQGATALALTIESGEKAIDARFEFGPLPENPTVPHGSYTMHGTVTRLGDGEFTVILEPDAWIEHPANYVMVGLQATTALEHSVLRGKITNATCADVELSRVR
jgi:hypothetical protein